MLLSCIKSVHAMLGFSIGRCAAVGCERTIATTCWVGQQANTKDKPKDKTKNASPSGDLYAALGLTEEATQTEIREAFYRKAKRLHPDVNPDKEAKDEFSMAQEAFNKLKDPKKRRNYDAETQGARKGIRQFELGDRDALTICCTSFQTEISNTN
jgi:hypothetical protein